MPTPTPHLNGGLRSKLPVLQSSTASSFPTNLKRTNDELRQHISRLKAELEVEKAKSKQAHRDRVADIKKLKDQYDREKLLAQTSTSDRVKIEHELEIKKLRESLQREKEAEIKQILKFKEEELRTTKKIMAEDKDFSLKEQDERLKREFSCKSRDSINETEYKLRQELSECKKQRQQFEELYKQKMAADSEKSELLRKLKEEHEKENQRVLRDARMQIARNVHELKTAQKALGEKEQEISKREMELTRLEEEKVQLLEKVKEVKQNGDVSDAGTTQRSEKEWELQLKNMELKKNMDELIKKLNLLEKDALGGKSNGKDGDVLAKYEQRVRELRKRNGELVNLARKLEDKAKHFQEELKEVKSKTPVEKPVVAEPQSAAAFENFKKTYTMQRAKDLAEHAKVSMRKDKEIAELKKRIADLEAALANSSSNVGEEKELEITIRQLQKEKLQLEKLFATKIVNERIAMEKGEAHKLKNKIKDAETENEKLEEVVSNQKKELLTKAEHLQSINEKCEELQILLARKEEQCVSMGYDLEAQLQSCHELERSLADMKEKNMKIESENERNTLMVTSLQNKLSESSKKLVHFENLEKEYSSLQERLSDAEKQCIVMQGQVEVFQEKVENFKKFEEDLKQSEENCTKWERDYGFAVGKINAQNKEIAELYDAQKRMQESYKQEKDTLKDEISRLEDICVDLESRENDLALKLQLKEDELKSVKSILTHDVYVQTSRPPTPMKADAVAEILQADDDSMAEAEVGGVVNNDPTANGSEKLSEGLFHDSGPSIPVKSDDDILDIASSRIAALAVISSSDGDFSHEDEALNEKLPENLGRKANTVKILRVNELMLQESRKPMDDGETSDELSLSLDEMSDDEDSALLNDGKFSATPKSSTQRKFDAKPVVKKQIQFEEQPAPSDPTSAQVEIIVTNDSNTHQSSNLMQTGVDKLSVFIAKYTYDPFEHSPNDDPSLELALEAGDYIYVFGDADEDGFYTGELVDGQRGLVPSNFVEKIADENELISFSKGYDSYPGDESDEDLTEVSWSCAESLTENEMDVPLDAEYFKVTPRPISMHSENGGLNDDTDYDSGDEIAKKRLSPPKNLKVERQLMNSVVISWLPPDDVEPEQIKGFSIRADGELKDTLIGTIRTKAIVSDVNRDKTCRITVHCLDKDEKEAEGSAAIITVGRGASAAPSDLNIFNLSATCADLEWTCGNSSMAHAVSLDGNEIHVVKPGIDRFKLTNLFPDHEYEVSVEARSQGEAYKRKSASDELLSHCLVFRTPKAGPPEPPLNVQVFVSKPSLDQKEAFIYVSWLPVTIVDGGTSTLGIVTGYRVYMNDMKVAIIEQPTEDHVKVFARDFEEILADRKLEFIELWMRTQSVYGESTISNVVILPVTDLLDRIAKHDKNKIKSTGIRNMDADKSLVEDNALHQGSKKLTSSALENDIRENKKNIKITEEMVDIVAREEHKAAVREEQKAVGREISEKVAMKEKKESTAPGKNEGERKGYGKLGVEKGPKVEVDTEKERIKTKKATVIRYNVTESDESEDSDDQNETDEEEDQCVFNILEETHDTDSKYDVMEKLQNKDVDSAKPKESVPENLILPNLPIVDKTAAQSEVDSSPPSDSPDQTEVTTRKHFHLEDLLSSSDSELSAIEEETIEELLEYDKSNNSLPTSDARNILNADRPMVKQLTDDMDVEMGKSSNNEKLPENLENTFSVHSENDKNKSYSMGDSSLRKLSDRVSEKSSGQTSKDSLTFSFDDVIDLLDKDIMGNVPDLPRDDEKESVKKYEDAKKPALSSGGKEKEPSIPVTDLANLSCDNDAGDFETGEEQMRDVALHSKPADASVKNGEEHIAVGSDDLPAKQTPVASKGQNNIDALQLSRELTEEVSSANESHFVEAEVSFEASEAESQTTTNKVINTTIEDNALENAVIDNRVEGVPKPRVSSDVVDSDVSNIETQAEPSEASSMGQSISLNLKSVPQYEVDFDDHEEFEDDKQVNVSLSAVHDIHSLSKAESSEDSELGSSAEYNPYFAPPSIEKNLEKENMGLEDDESSERVEHDIASTLAEQPAIENGSRTEHSNVTGIMSIEEARESNGNQTRNNASIDESERTIEDTRSKHVDEETKPNSVRVFVALFTYDPITMSPNTEGVEEELAFTEGDLIKIFGECDEDGFYYGELRDRCGFVPSNMVQEVNLGNFGNSFNIPPPEEDCMVDTEESISADRQQESISYSQANSVTSGLEKSSQKEVQSFPAAQRARKEDLDASRELNTKPKKSSGKMDDIVASLGDISIEDNHPDYRYISERNSIYCLPPTRMIALYDYDPAVSSPNVDSEVELAFNKGDIILVFGDMDEDGFYAAQSHEERGLVPSNFLAECPELSDSEEIEIDIGAASPSIKTSSRKSSAASIKGASPVDSPKTKKKKGLFAKGKKIFSKLKGK